MAEARRRRSVRVGVGVGLPLVAAVALVALLLRLFPVDATSQWDSFPLSSPASAGPDSSGTSAMVSIRGG